MDILFEAEEQNEFGVSFVGLAGEDPVGHALLLPRDKDMADLIFINLVDKESGDLSLREFAEAFFRYLKDRGYKELQMRSEYPDSGDALGFRLEERDNSGWYPKYYFRREL